MSEIRRPGPEEEGTSSAESFYNQFWRSNQWGGSEPNPDEASRLDSIIRLIARIDRRPLEILDLGCGRGWLTKELSRFGSVLGIDPVKAAIIRARELHPAIDFQSTDIDALIAERGEGSFDLVVSSEVLEHVPSTAKPGFMRSIQRSLRPGGHAILTTPRGELRELWMASTSQDQPVEDWVTEAELADLARLAGLLPVETTRCFVYGLNLPSRILASRPGQFLRRTIPGFERLTYPFRTYQVALLRRSDG